MKNQDYIRKAVELADGWAFNFPWVVTPIEDIDQFNYNVLPDVFKDALAAQLVRQVDALEDPQIGLQLCRGVTVVDIYLPEAPLRQAAVDGTNRTMNTIKVIVNSGVLKK